MIHRNIVLLVLFLFSILGKGVCVIREVANRNVSFNNTLRGQILSGTPIKTYGMDLLN